MAPYYLSNFFFIPLHPDFCSLCSSPLIFQTLSCFRASGFTSSIPVLSMAGFLSRLAPSLTISFSLNTTSSVVNTFFKHSIWICYFLLFFGFVLCFVLDLDLFSQFFSLLICLHSAALHTLPNSYHTYTHRHQMVRPMKARSLSVPFHHEHTVPVTDGMLWMLSNPWYE